MLSPRYTTRYEDLLQVKWQVYPDFHIPDVMEPQPHRMQGTGCGKLAIVR
ncbi:hypothetical protein SEPB56_17498 [Salmonella enterica subsp. enterica serovar Paratyphi B str. SARA56]|nr:hypothetical protein SEPB56_17498 [Salmonella enterica subsp. enterica serovar Paratyphi B str. SARA56]